MVNGEGLLSKIVWVRIYAAKNIKLRKKLKLAMGWLYEVGI